MNDSDRERRDWALFLLFLVLGIILMLAAGQFAIRLASQWNVNADMHSELDPNKNFSNYRQVGVYAPLRPEILTPPSWANTFLTPQPGIGLTVYPVFVFAPSETPAQPTFAVSASAVATAGASSTPPGVSTPTSAPNPTSTPFVIFFWPTRTQAPAPTNTKEPPPADTPIPIPSVPEIVVEGPGSVNIADGGTYDLGTTLVGTPLTQTITVRNTGTAILNLLTAPPTVTGGFAATTFGSISLAAGAATTFDLTCNAPTPGAPVSGIVSFNNNDSDEAPFDFTVTCTVNAPEIVVEGPGPVNIAVGSTYDLGTTMLGTPLTQPITVRNTGTANLDLTAPLTVMGDFSITSFALPITVAPGASTTFNLTCNANSSGYPVSGTVSFGNNDSDETPFSFSVTCTVNVVPIPPPPAINIGNPDTTFYTLVCPPPLVFTISPSISTGPGDDFVYYERYADLGGGNYGIFLDLVKVEISADNSTWYTVFNWGDGLPDTNTNLAGFSPETDNYPIPEASLFNGSGILINIDPIVPPGYYPYMRFSGDCGTDGAEIDAIDLLH